MDLVPLWQFWHLKSSFTNCNVPLTLLYLECCETRLCGLFAI